MANENIEQVVDPNAQPVVENIPAPVNLKDDDLVEIVYKGEKVVKPWKEARANVQMQEDYTRSKQEVSRQAQEVQKIFNELTARQKAIAEKETALDTILGRQPKNKVEEPAPDEVLNHAQLQEALRKNTEQVMATFESKLNEKTTQESQARMFQRWEDLTTSTVESLLKEHPALKRIPQLATIVRLEAGKDKPTSEKEMVEFMVKAGKRLAKDIDDEFIDREKTKALRKEQLKSGAPVAAGGGPQFVAPKKDYMKKGSRGIDWEAISKDAESALDGIEE